MQSTVLVLLFTLHMGSAVTFATGAMLLYMGSPVTVTAVKAPALPQGWVLWRGRTQDVRHKQSHRDTHAANCMNCVLFTGMEVATEPSKQTGENMAITSSLPGDMAMENMELPGMAASAVAPMCCMAGVLRLGY